MKGVVHLAKESPLQLRYGFAVYSAELNFDGAYATTADARVGDGGKVEFGPWRPVGMEFVRSLAESLGVNLKPEVLPPNVLCRTPDLVVWWTPPALQTLFFSNAPLKELDGEVLPVPALVWRLKTAGNVLRVRALAKDERPGAGTELYHAPFWNVEADGRVCQGSMRRPQRVDINALGGWCDGFFGAAFGSQLHERASAVRAPKRGDIAALWPRLRRKKRFPSELLLPSGETLASFVEVR